MEFTKATKKKAKLRATFNGPAGSGKTYTALKVATSMGGRTAAIDTEHGSLSKYGHVFDVDVLELDIFAPAQYVLAIRSAEKAGYDNLVIDSLSHAWIGKGGALEMADKATAASRSKNSFNAWGQVTPHHLDLIEAIVTSSCHIFATMRTHAEYVQQQNNGKTEITKVGTTPFQRAGMEYEFDVIGDMDMNHNMFISKSRMLDEEGNNFLDGLTFEKPGKEFAQILLDWLESGAEMPKITDEQVSTLQEWLDTTASDVPKFLEVFHIPNLKKMRPDQYPGALAMLEKKAAIMAKKAGVAA